MAASSGSKPSPTMWTVSPAKVTEISVPVRYFMPCARAAAAARCWPPISSWSVNDQSSTPLAAARSASASGVSVPSDTTEWQCRSALRMEVTARVYSFSEWLAASSVSALLPERDPGGDGGEGHHDGDHDPEAVLVLRQRDAADVHAE